MRDEAAIIIALAAALAAAGWLFQQARRVFRLIDEAETMLATYRRRLARHEDEHDCEGE